MHVHGRKSGGLQGDNSGGLDEIDAFPKTHRIHAAAISELFTRGVVSLQCESAQNAAADIGAKRFTDPLEWVKGALPC